MKLGMNMLLWSTDVSGSEYDPVFAMLKDAGYDGVEIPICDREIDKYAALGRRLADLGLEALAVSARGADENPIAADPGVRAEALAATKRTSTRGARCPVDCGPLGARSESSGAAPTVEEKARVIAYLR